jgi:hypothetical protein
MWKANRRRMPSNGKSSHCLWQGELKRCVIQQQLFRIISVLKIKGQLITCKIIYLLFVTICLVFAKDVPPPFFVDILKASFQTLRMAVTIKLLNI